MTFTYDLASADPEVVRLSKVRLEIGDKTAGAGVCPDGSNLADEEIKVWLEREGDPMLAAAAGCEALARSWAVMHDVSVGPRRESFGQVAKQYSEQADKLRSQYGSSGGGSFSVGWKRTDGFSEAAG